MHTGSVAGRRLFRGLMLCLLAFSSTAAFADHRGSQRPSTTPVPVQTPPPAEAPRAEPAAAESSIFDSDFLVLSGAAGWQSEDSVGYVEAGALYGLQFGDGEGRYWKPWRVFVSMEGDRDNRSRVRQGVPDTFFENRLITSAGVAWLPIDQISLVAQYDVAHEISNLDRGTDSGVKLAVQAYHQWGYYPEVPEVPRFVGNVYAELAYQSRFDDDVTFDSTLNAGFRAFEQPWAVFDVLGVVRTFGSSNNNRGFFNFVDTGAQVSWKPTQDSPVSVNLRSVWRFNADAKDQLETEVWLGYWKRFDL